MGPLITILQFIKDSIDRPAEEFDESGPTAEVDEARGMEGPIWWRNHSIPGLPGVFATVLTAAVSPHGRVRDFDRSRRVTNEGQQALHRAWVLPRVDDLLPDRDRRRIRDGSMARPEKDRSESA